MSTRAYIGVAAYSSSFEIGINEAARCSTKAHTNVAAGAHVASEIARVGFEIGPALQARAFLSGRNRFQIPAELNVPGQH